jgi:hypothetical protein
MVDCSSALLSTTAPYAKGLHEEEGFVYDYYLADADDLDFSRGRFDLDVAVDQWASDEESRDGNEAAATFGVDDEDSNDGADICGTSACQTDQAPTVTRDGLRHH